MLRNLRKANPLAYSLITGRIKTAIKIIRINNERKSKPRVYFDVEKQRPFVEQKTFINLPKNKRPQIPGMKNAGKIIKRGQ